MIFKGPFQFKLFYDSIIIIIIFYIIIQRFKPEFARFGNLFIFLKTVFMESVI